MKIKDLPKIDRPREKLDPFDRLRAGKYGPERLSNSELLTILLRTGNEEGSSWALRPTAQRGLPVEPLGVEKCGKVKGILHIYENQRFAKNCSLFVQERLPAFGGRTRLRI